MTENKIHPLLFAILLFLSLVYGLAFAMLLGQAEWQP